MASAPSAALVLAVAVAVAAAVLAAMPAPYAPDPPPAHRPPPLPPFPPPPAFADGETTCRISVSASAYPVYYDGSIRRNPDGTVYPGDAVNYLFRYAARLYGDAAPGSAACDSLRAGPVEARGRYLAPGAQHASGPSDGFDPSPHPSVHRGVDARWLRTDHYFRSWWDGYACGTIPYLRVYSCERTGLQASAYPSFSVRSDAPMSARERAERDRWILGGPNRGFEVRSTHDLHLVAVSSSGGVPPRAAPADPPLEDAASAAAFAAAVRAACSGLPAGSGCVFGRAEVVPRADNGRECLSGIIASRMPRLLGPPAGPMDAPLGPGAPTRAQWEQNPSLKAVTLSGGTWNASAPVSEMTVDECASSGAERLSFSVSAVQVRHDPAYEHAHRAVRVERGATAPAPIAEPRVSVLIERPPMLDSDGHPSANADGTYYEWDLPSVHVRPSVRFGDERHGTLSFSVGRDDPPPFPEVFTHACLGAVPCLVAAGDGGVHMADTPVRSSPGDRLDVFRPDSGSIGGHTIGYAVQLLNIGRPVSGTLSMHDVPVRVVPYVPWYSAAFAYTALAGPGHTTLEKMHALVLRYEGSIGEDGGEAHPGRRSKVSSAGAGVTYGAAAEGSGGVPVSGAASSTMSLASAAGLAEVAGSAPPAALGSLPGSARGPWHAGSAPVSAVAASKPEAAAVAAGGASAATAVIGGAGMARLLLAHDPPGPPGLQPEQNRSGAAAEAEDAAAQLPAALGDVLLSATVESRMFGGKDTVRLASYSYSYPTAHVSAPFRVAAVQGPGGASAGNEAGGTAEAPAFRPVHVEAALAPAPVQGGQANSSAVSLAAFMLDHLERTAELWDAESGRPGSAHGGGNASRAGGMRAGTMTADPAAHSVEIDRTSYGLALVEPLRGADGGRAGADAAAADAADAAAEAARAICPRGSAVLYGIDNGTGGIFGVPQASVECGGRSLNGALIGGGHARVRTAMCAHSEFALAEWALRGCAPAVADAASFVLAGPAEPSPALQPAPFPAAAFAAAYAGDMHDTSNAAAGPWSAAGTAGIGHVLILPAADALLGAGAAAAAARAAAGASVPGSSTPSGFGTVEGRYGEAAALGSPPPYDLVVTAGANSSRTAAVRVGPHAFSSPIEYEFAAGPSPGGIVLEPDAPSPHVVRVRAADWFGRIAELRVDGEPATSAASAPSLPGSLPTGGDMGPHAGHGGGWGGPPCRPYCEVRLPAARAGSGGGAVDITAVNAWGGTASLLVDVSSSGGGSAAPGSAAAAADRAYGSAVAYAESSVPYLAAACIVAACLSAYVRHARRGPY